MKRYLIGEVIKELGCCRKTIFNWERAGKIPKPRRDGFSGYRYWTEKDLKKLKRLKGA
jgi:DNA-binding transcriptional MerR regulator